MGINPIIGQERPCLGEWMDNIEIKTIGQLIDELTVVNIRIWHAVDKMAAGESSPEETQETQLTNSKRRQLVHAITRRLGEPDAKS